MKITKHAQSCLLVETNNTKILIDPGVFVTEKEGFDLNNFKSIDAIIISHQHSDHFSPENLEVILKNNPDTKVYTTQAVNELFSNSEVLNNGDVVQVRDCKIEGVYSIHGPLPNGMEPPVVLGVLISDGESTFYDPSDTVELFVEADIIATPICGKVVMDIQKAKEELLRLKPKFAFPIHFDNPVFPVVPQDFVKEMEGTGVECRQLDLNESVEF